VLTGTQPLNLVLVSTARAQLFLPHETKSYDADELLALARKPAAIAFCSALVRAAPSARARRRLVCLPFRAPTEPLHVRASRRMVHERASARYRACCAARSPTLADVRRCSPMCVAVGRVPRALARRRGCRARSCSRSSYRRSPSAGGARPPGKRAAHRTRRQGARDGRVRAAPRAVRLSPSERMASRALASLRAHHAVYMLACVRAYVRACVRVRA
jgi:hypothetical protein